MAPQEKIEIVDRLENGRLELIAVISGMTEAQAATRPAPDRWSVLECVEHVNSVEKRFLGMVEKSEPQDAAAPDQAKEAALEERVLNRTNRRTAPEAVQPAGAYTSIAEALEHFNAGRDRTIRFAEENAARLYTLSAMHPVMGPLNGVEALLLIACHGLRHTAQMREAAEGR